ncbi:MAG: hypothetical protein GXO27_04310 [Chlorobi bacterium]|nr:hypothetical protein [Chlorobiota bacterium]
MSRFIINLFIIIIPLITGAQADTLARKFPRISVTGIRVGYDIGKKAWSLYKEGNIDEINVYVNFGNHILGIRGGREDMPVRFPLYGFHTTGTYFKAEYAYNFYENWPGMRNEITVGVRYGTARFDYRLDYLIRLPVSPLYSPDTLYPGTRWNGLRARWLEASASVKAEIYKGFFLELHVSGKYFLGGTRPENFGLVYIPGFYITNISRFGFGLGYGISYFFDFRRFSSSRLRHKETPVEVEKTETGQEGEGNQGIDF